MYTYGPISETKEKQNRCEISKDIAQEIECWSIPLTYQCVNWLNYSSAISGLWLRGGGGGGGERGPATHVTRLLGVGAVCRSMQLML